MTKRQNKKVKSEEVPAPSETEVVLEEQKVNSPTFVVVRGGCRVSENEYATAEDLAAIVEKDFWQKVVERFPDGTKVEIVPFDKKKHKIW